MSEKVKVGQVYRDTYMERDNPRLAHRKIRILEVLPNGVLAETITDASGRRLAVPRKTRLMFKSLRAGYVLVQENAS